MPDGRPTLRSGEDYADQVYVSVLRGAQDYLIMTARQIVDDADGELTPETERKLWELFEHGMSLVEACDLFRVQTWEHWRDDLEARRADG